MPLSLAYRENKFTAQSLRKLFILDDDFYFFWIIVLVLFENFFLIKIDFIVDLGIAISIIYFILILFFSPFFSFSCGVLL